MLSYANQEIRYVGRVAEFAFNAPKPEEFGNAGVYWNRDGWLLPVYWTPLTPAVRPKTLISSLGQHLPTRYSPIHPITGNGNQKAYLAQIPRAAFDVIVASAVFDHIVLARGGSNSLNFEVVSELLDDAVERRVAVDLTLDDTVRRSVVMARRGQGVFRSNVERIERSCRLTGITNPSLLIASHIKPWRNCSSAQERLDGHNGLLLTPDADLLFDRGFISFSNEGGVLVSQRVQHADMRRLGFEHLVHERLGFEEAPTPWGNAGLSDGQRRYMEHHRPEVFIS
ncbi:MULTISPECIES: HNH endonuclease [unclassified Mesorhizobium]|uniref:HNH endonuclease n=1 Tax=unclassified Mesorhizobium TaxID=325217 RepID=UPI0015E32EC1|nr:MULTISPECIES: HNH endonuclease [unclassified Mesorhizobium]